MDNRTFIPDPSCFDSEELIASGKIPPKGKKVTFCGKGEDVERTVMKSDTAILSIPELDLQIPAGNPRFATIKDFLLETKNNLEKSSSYFTMPKQQLKFQSFFSTIEKILDGQEKVTIILDDPLGNVFIESRPGDDNDKKIQIQEYTRSFRQCLDLGIPYK